MLIDWVWASLLTLLLWCEVGGWARLLTKSFLGRVARDKLGPRLSYALAFGVTAQGYFYLSLLGRASPGLHVALMIIGIVLVALPRSVSRTKSEGPGAEVPPLAGEPRLHLKLARYLSPLNWKRSAPWLVLPVVWAGLRLLDALMPHNANIPLAYTLAGPRRWLEDGTQLLDPLFPQGAAASVWEGLTYHLLIIIKALGPVHRAALVRTQLTAQLVHLSAGQFLFLMLLARLILPFLRSGWDAFVHLESSTERRHQLGMASSVAVPASIFFAWIACGPTSASATLATNDWAASMLVLAAVSLLLVSSEAITWLASGFLWGTAVAAHSSEVNTAAGFLAVIVFTLYRPGWRRHLTTQVAAVVLGIGLGLAPWAWRNWNQAGVLFYPPMPIAWEADWGWAVKTLLCLGLPALGYYLARARARVGSIDSGVLALTLLSSLGFILEFWRGSLTPSVGVTLLCLAALGIEFLLTLPKNSQKPQAGRAVPAAWLVIGLVIVPVPIHLLWQDLGRAFHPSDEYLAEYHRNFGIKLWASLHLPAASRILWTSDNEFYYLEQPSASIRESAIIHGALSRAPNPIERARILCELGFDVLAWEERDHDSETSGLASWLSLAKNPVLHSADGVTLYDLKCHI